MAASWVRTCKDAEAGLRHEGRRPRKGIVRPLPLPQQPVAEQRTRPGGGSTRPKGSEQLGVRRANEHFLLVHDPKSQVALCSLRLFSPCNPTQATKEPKRVWHGWFLPVFLRGGARGSRTLPAPSLLASSAVPALRCAVPCRFSPAIKPSSMDHGRASEPPSCGDRPFVGLFREPRWQPACCGKLVTRILPERPASALRCDSCFFLSRPSRLPFIGRAAPAWGDKSRRRGLDHQRR